MASVYLLLLFPLLSSGQLKIPAADDNLNIYALPVGQGDATVIQCPQHPQHGDELAVVDMGASRNKGFMGRHQIRWWLDGKPVRKVFLTHPDIDHFNMIDAIQTMGGNVANDLTIYHTCPTESYQGVSLEVAKWGANLERIGACVARDWNKMPTCASSHSSCPNISICGDRATVFILAAGLNGCKNGGTNSDSMVIKVKLDNANSASAIILGDFEDKNSNPNPVYGSPYHTLLSCANVASDVMRLAHHGAYGVANKNSLLLQINPQMVFSSSGFLYHHPRCEIKQFFTEWKLDFKNKPNHLPKPRLLIENAYHGYTCWNSQADRYSSPKIKKSLYVTSFCQNIGGNMVWINAVRRFALTNTGTVKTAGWIQSDYPEEDVPSGVKFPC